MSQQGFNTSTEIPSASGAVLIHPRVHIRPSSIDKPSSHGTLACAGVPHDGSLSEILFRSRRASRSMFTRSAWSDTTRSLKLNGGGGCVLTRFVLVYQLINLRDIGHRLDWIFPILPLGYCHSIPNFLG